jgi:hypothetical protein
MAADELDERVLSALVLTLIVLVAVRPPRENVLSMASVRRDVYARRTRPASARGYQRRARCCTGVR